MMTRRRTLGGLLAATFGGGVLTAGAFSSSSTAAADLRVVVTSELTLTPEREDEAYVEVDQAGEVAEIVLENDSQAGVSTSQSGGGFALRGARPDHEQQRHYLRRTRFRVRGDQRQRRPGRSVEKALGIIHEGTVIHDGGGVATILQDEGESLGPGENEVFGVEVDLSEIGDFPEASFDVELRITAKREED